MLADKPSVGAWNRDSVCKDLRLGHLSRYDSAVRSYDLERSRGPPGFVIASYKLFSNVRCSVRRFNAFLSLFGIMCLCLTPCCPAPVGDPGDNVADNPDQGDPTGSDDSPPGDDPSDDTPGDPGSDPPGTDECTVDLNGFWVDHASTDRYVEIRHAGGSVSAVYIDGPFVCEHRDEAGTTSQTDNDLSGTLAGCVLTGTVTTCTFGCPEP